MKKLTKEDIKHTVEKAFGSALDELKVSAPSKKTKKILAKATRKVSRQLKLEIKDLYKKMKPATSGTRKKVVKHNGQVAA